MDPPDVTTLSEEEEMQLLEHFASMLGPGFHKSRQSCLRAFEDTVYYAHFGCIQVDGIADDHNEIGFASFHESSVDNDGAVVILEDPIEIEAKIHQRDLVEGDGKWSQKQLEEAGLVLSELEAASPIIRGDVGDEVGQQWVNSFHANAGIQKSLQSFPHSRSMIHAVDNMRADRVHTIECPPMPPVNQSAVPGRNYELQISDESLSCIARRAGCVSLDRDCYDVLRGLARDRIQELLVSCIKSTSESSRNIILANDVTTAFRESTKCEMLGYGYRG
jgi:hypothetical protein